VKYSYFLPDGGETAADARPLFVEMRYAEREIVRVHDYFDNAREAAELAAEKLFDGNGVESPIAIVGEDGNIEVFDVAVERIPSFVAAKRP
jgi:hypothetical protein